MYAITYHLAEAFIQCDLYVSEFVHLSSWQLRALLKGTTVTTWECWDLNARASGQYSYVLTTELQLSWFADWFVDFPQHEMYDVLFFKIK